MVSSHRLYPRLSETFSMAFSTLLVLCSTTFCEYLAGISHDCIRGVAAAPPMYAHSLISPSAGRLHPPLLAGIVRSSFWKCGISSTPTRAHVALATHWPRWVAKLSTWAGGVILKTAHETTEGLYRWGRCARHGRHVDDPSGKFLGCLFSGLQKGLHVVGVSDWEGQGGLRRWVFACGRESTDHESSVVAAFSHRARAFWVSGGFPSVVHAVHVSSFSFIPALVSASRNSA